MAARSIAVTTPELAADRLGFFRWGRMAGKVLVTTDGGDWAWLAETEFNDLLAGRVVAGHPCFQELQAKGFLRDGLDLGALADRVARRLRHLARGPQLHVLTLIASHAAGAAMSRETAERAVELALQSTAPSLTFEFQGGEPLANFEVLRHVVEFARAQGEKAGKTLAFSLASNLTAMSEDKAEWLIANDVGVCTSLDGPATVHDANRKWKPGSPHAEVVRWLEFFTRRYAELERDPQQWRVDALLTATRQTLAAWREVIDEYVARGLQSIHLRPLNPAAYTPETWAAIGYTAEEYLETYKQALDYILELNRHGVVLVERMAAIFATKILAAENAGFTDIQSPNGAGISQLVYTVDGRVFPSEEARLVDALGDPIFDLGPIGELTIPDILRHPTVRAIGAASVLDVQPMCAECWNKPFCGISPVYNFMNQQSLFGQRPRSMKCKEHMAVSGRVFELLANEGDSETTAILKRWASARPRAAGEGRASREAP